MHAPIKSPRPFCGSALRRACLPALLLAAVLTYFFQVQPFRPADPLTESFLLETAIQSSRAGVARLYYDHGDGFRRPDSTVVKIEPGAQVARFLVPPNRYQGFRFDPLDLPGDVVIRPQRIVTTEGRVMHDFTRAEWRTAARLPGSPATTLTYRTQRALVLLPPIDLAAALIQFTGLALVLTVLLTRLAPWWSRNADAWRHRGLRWAEQARRHPRLTLFVVAFAAILVSCHPVIFFGRSFVTPNNRALCVYDDFPTLPGGAAAPIENSKGSDIGAMMWAHLPYSVVQHRAIFQDHQLPLWNRFSQSGLTLLGQGQSMIGDPLHWITIAANGASWAWDLKFLLAKLLFAFGIGLLVHAVTRQLGVAALLGASAAFIGFFAYRLNHAAFFSLSYAPWILLGWLAIARGCGLRGAILLTVALGMESQSGTAKESTLLIAGLSFAGALSILLLREPPAARARKLALGLAAVVVFLLASAPSWMTFADSLRRAETVSDLPRALQIQPSQLLGLFEDLFYRQQVPNELHTNPSANFLVLLGLLWAAVNLRRLAANRAFPALALGALPPFALAFGLVPPAWIERLPLIGKISHIDNTFSCVLIVLLFPLAGLGLQACRERFALREWRGDWLLTLGLAAGLAALYFGHTQAVSRADALYFKPRAALLPSSFFTGYVPLLFLSIALLPLAARRLLHERRDLLAAGLIAACALGALHFRHGMYVGTKFDHYVMNPQPRLDLTAHSPAIDYIAAQTTEPSRVAGLGAVLAPGFQILYGLEHFSGPDAVLNRQYRELLAAAQIPIADDWRHLVYGFSYPGLRPFYDLLGVRWLLGTPGSEKQPIPGLDLRTTRDLDVFESPTAWPRAFFTDRVSSYETAADFAALVAASDGRPFAAIQRTGPGSQRDWALPADQATRQLVQPLTYHLLSNLTGFQIETPSPGLVVLGEAWLDGDLHVTIDGKLASYVRVNHAFRGVWVGNSGPHWIEFSYRPRILKPAAWCAAVGLILLCCALGVTLRRGLVE